MKYVIDIETNRLENPDKLWVVVVKCIETQQYLIFRNVTENGEERERLTKFLKGLWDQPDNLLIGHHILGFDYPILNSILELRAEAVPAFCVDTLILSKLIDYSREGHSIEDYGLEFGLEKGKFNDWSKYSMEMEKYCIRDVDITERVFVKYSKYFNNPKHHSAIRLEHDFQGIVNGLHNSGFAFNKDRAEKLLSKVEAELAELDVSILSAFPPRTKLIKEVHPKETKYGTLSRTDFRWLDGGDLSIYNGGSFSRFSWEPFNPSSHKQIIRVLSDAGWRPIERTKTHVETEREYNRLKRLKGKSPELDLELKSCHDKLVELRKTGWKVNEANLQTLPARAPAAAKMLAKRILLESRRRTLVEWTSLVTHDQRIHGKFYGLGAWTHRMAHQNPNTANIPNEFDTQGITKLLGKELRQLWIAPKGRLLVGVDAEGIQLRIFAHYIDDPEFTKALVEGKKEDKSDPHSLNQRVLGSVCKSRSAAKRFIFALLLGAGLGKLAEILGCSEGEAEAALERLIQRYEGFALLKATTIPRDARRGWFEGIDGRSVRIPGDTEGSRRHLAMSGYLQNGEAVVIKTAAVIAAPKLVPLDSFFVDIIHDEFQTESPNNMTIALQVSGIIKDAIAEAGRILNLRCPLAGSDYNDDHKDYTIGVNWYATH